MTTFILLGAYNGARHVDEQLGSIVRQTATDWRLLARDDGSTDETPGLLHEWARRDARIEVVADQEGRLGAAGNFNRLMERALELGATRVALADQDDVWLPTKLALQAAKLEAAEAAVGPATPLLVHSDLQVVDANLKLIHSSFLKYQGLNLPRRAHLAALCVQNFVTGCTILANRALLEACLPVSPQAVLHDWWLALSAAALGKVLFVDAATVLYRQHAANAVGAKGYRRWLYELPRRKWRRTRELSPEFCATVVQARAARDRLGPCADSPDRVLHDYCELFETPMLGSRRVQGMRRLRAVRRDGLRNALLQARLLLAPPGSFRLMDDAPAAEYAERVTLAKRTG